MKRLKVKKEEILQIKGDLSNKVYVVEKGLLRSYSIDEKGKEHIFMFAPKGWIVADASAINGKTDLFIDALEDSEVILKKGFEWSEMKNSLLLMKRIAVLQKRIIMLMSKSALERYNDFVVTYPEIVQRVPQKMIASYLGITPEALSKVKSKRKTKT